MKLIRSFLGFFVLLYERLFSPRAMVRSKERQLEVDQECERLKIYEFEACPFCMKVRLEMKRLALPIEKRDVLKNKTFEQELLSGGGERQVPCLRIDEGGQIRWLYESDDIISYLKKRFQ